MATENLKPCCGRVHNPIPLVNFPLQSNVTLFPASGSISNTFIYIPCNAIFTRQTRYSSLQQQKTSPQIGDQISMFVGHNLIVLDMSVQLSKIKITIRRTIFFTGQSPTLWLIPLSK
jgi:hypothetical protein